MKFVRRTIDAIVTVVILRYDPNIVVVVVVVTTVTIEVKIIIEPPSLSPVQ